MERLLADHIPGQILESCEQSKQKLNIPHIRIAVRTLRNATLNYPLFEIHTQTISNLKFTVEITDFYGENKYNFYPHSCLGC